MATAACGSGPFPRFGLASSPLASAFVLSSLPYRTSLLAVSPLLLVVLAVRLPPCAKSPLSSATPASIPTAVLDLELCVSLLCSADSSCPIPPLCLKDSASGAGGEWFRGTSKSSPASPKASPQAVGSAGRDLLWREGVRPYPI